MVISWSVCQYTSSGILPLEYIVAYSRHITSLYSSTDTGNANWHLTPSIKQARPIFEAFWPNESTSKISSLEFSWNTISCVFASTRITLSPVKIVSFLRQLLQVGFTRSSIISFGGISLSISYASTGKPITIFPYR